MLDRDIPKTDIPEPKTDIPEACAAPFVSSTMNVEPQWIDYNGHLNMAYYNVLFDRGADQAFAALGMGPGYLEQRRLSSMTAEAHVRYLREIHEGTPVRVTCQLLGADAKRVHFFQEMRHAEEGWLSATSEVMLLHVDMTKRKVAPFPDDIAANIAAMLKAHAGLPRPAGAGRRIGIPERPGTGAKTV
jgi:acyl-CoA thioester hydrolase